MNTWNQATTLLTAAEATLVESGPLPRGGYDLAPDEFSFSFPGYSGKFYLNQAGQWQVKSDRPLKVVFDNTFLNVPMSTGMLHRLAGKRTLNHFLDLPLLLKTVRNINLVELPMQSNIVLVLPHSIKTIGLPTLGTW